MVILSWKGLLHASVQPVVVLSQGAAPTNPRARAISCQRIFCPAVALWRADSFLLSKALTFAPKTMRARTVSGSSAWRDGPDVRGCSSVIGMFPSAGWLLLSLLFAGTVEKSISVTPRKYLFYVTSVGQRSPHGHVLLTGLDFRRSIGSGLRFSGRSAGLLSRVSGW